jgi:hypothetical protein
MAEPLINMAKNDPPKNPIQDEIADLKRKLATHGDNPALRARLAELEKPKTANER